MKLFIYFSEVLGNKVLDSDGKVVGRVFDVTMRLSDDVFPLAESIIIKRGLFKKEYARIYFSNLIAIGREFRLKTEGKDIVFKKERVQSDFSLCRHILDQQVVDVNDQKVVRVNDIHLLCVDNQLYFAHVDVGLRGIIRRLGWTNLIDFIVKVFFPKSAYLTVEEFIPWKNTQVLNLGRGKNVLKSSMARQKLAKIPPTQLAEIMEDLDVFEKLSLFKSFTFDLQSKVFTDMAMSEKEEIIDQLAENEAANLIENIPADEATDLLHRLSKERRAELMSHMHTKTSRELRKLLGFAQDTAGGLMTKEYLFLKKDALVKDAIQKIKDNIDYPGNLFFIYIVDDEHHLIQAASIRRFLNEDPNKLLIDTCFPNQIFVCTDDSVEEVALLLEKYKFTSIPVVDENNVLQGVITIDDVMEELISLAWRKYEGQL